MAYVPVSANWESTSSGHFKSRLAMPISPLAKPRPSTTATITEAPEIVDADEEVVPVNKNQFEWEISNFRLCQYLRLK